MQVESWNVTKLVWSLKGVPRDMGTIMKKHSALLYDSNPFDL